MLKKTEERKIKHALNISENEGKTTTRIRQTQ